MKIFVDDIRDAPDGWVLVRTISEAVTILRLYDDRITHVSLDHDISIPVKVGGEWYNRPSPDTFKVVAYFMQLLLCREDGGLREDIVITTHSSNPEGRKAIVEIFADIGIDCEETPMDRAKRNK